MLSTHNTVLSTRYCYQHPYSHLETFLASDFFTVASLASYFFTVASLVYLPYPFLIHQLFYSNCSKSGWIVDSISKCKPSCIVTKLTKYFISADICHSILLLKQIKYLPVDAVPSYKEVEPQGSHMCWSWGNVNV